MRNPGVKLADFSMLVVISEIALDIGDAGLVNLSKRHSDYRYLS